MTPTEPLFNGPNGGYAICFPCGTKYGFSPVKGTGMGMWNDTCAICGQLRACANAYHDFGLSDIEVEGLKQK